MQRLCKATCLATVVFLMAGCMASTSSPIGINCGSSAEKPIWERPIDCQGR